MAVGMRVPKTTTELIGALECALAILDICKQDPPAPVPTRVMCFPQAKTELHWCLPQAAHPPSLANEPMPTVSEPPSLAPAQKPWLTDCLVYSPSSPHLPLCGSRGSRALVDSGSTITLIHPSVLIEAAECCSMVKVTCMHENAREVATAYVHIRDERSEENVTVGVVPDLSVPLLLGRDWLGFLKELPATRRVMRHWVL